MVVLDFITRQMELYYFYTEKFHFTYLYCNVITRHYRESNSESFTNLHFFCHLRHKFVHQKLVCEFINTFSCHSECTTMKTLILTPNVNSQWLLFRIATDENLRYIALFKTFPAMWFVPINVASPINTVDFYIVLL